MNIKDNDELLRQYKKGMIYRKVEKEIDWKDELKEFLSTPAEYNKFSQVALLGMAANLTESEFIGMCHLVASLTDKPE